MAFFARLRTKYFGKITFFRADNHYFEPLVSTSKKHWIPPSPPLRRMAEWKNREITRHYTEKWKKHPSNVGKNTFFYSINVKGWGGELPHFPILSVGDSRTTGERKDCFPKRFQPYSWWCSRTDYSPGPPPPPGCFWSSRAGQWRG
jgi:hypothetical protein